MTDPTKIDYIKSIDEKLKKLESQPDSKPWTIELLRRIKKQQDNVQYDPNIQLYAQPIPDEHYLETYNRYKDDFEGEIETEVMLDDSSARTNLLPIRYQEFWDCYQFQISNMWHVEEINFDDDKFDTLPIAIQIYVIFILAFFAGIDGIINNNLGERFVRDVKIREALVAYDFQKMMENIHNHTYNLNIEIYVPDEDIRDILFNSIQYMPSIQDKAKWAYKWINSDKTFAHRIVAFIAIEGINFSGSFGSVFWLQSVGYILTGLYQSNNFIRRDETLHVLFAIEIYNFLKNKLRPEVIKEIFAEAVENEIRFINDALASDVIGLKAESMANYIRYVANDLLNDMDITPLYEIDDASVEREFKFMIEGSMETKNNFFEARGDAYQSAHSASKRKIFNKNADV